MGNRSQRILMQCKDWGYIQYFTALLSKCSPHALLRIVENPKEIVQTAKNEAFDIIIFDNDKISPDIETPIYEMSSLASHPKIFVFTAPQIHSAAIHSPGCETVKRPYRHEEIIKFIGQQM